MVVAIYGNIKHKLSLLKNANALRIHGFVVDSFCRSNFFFSRNSLHPLSLMQSPRTNSVKMGLWKKQVAMQEREGREGRGH